MTAIETVPETTAVYRFFDSFGSLLYVGVTSNISTRLSQHDQAQPWWRLVASVKVEHHDNREAALDAERAAIHTERPRFNKMHAHGAMIKKTYYVPLKLYDAVVAKSDEQEETVADVIRRAFEEYVTEDGS